MSMLSADINEADEALRFIDSGDTDLWLKMGMALKTEFGESAFSIWDDWSSSFERYNPKETKARWKSFKDSGRSGRVEIGSLFYHAQQSGWKRNGTAQPRQMTADEIAARKQRQLDAEQARIDEQEAVAAKALKIWQKLGDNGTSPYLQRKGVGAYGVRFAKNGAIAVPLYDMSGKLWSLEFIGADGEKRFLSGGKKSGCFHRIKGDTVIAIGEGYATMATVFIAMGWTSVVAFDRGNLLAVARAWREKYPHRSIVIIGDNDPPDQQGRRLGVDNAIEAAAAVAGRAIFPDFSTVV